MDQVREVLLIPIVGVVVLTLIIGPPTSSASKKRKSNTDFLVRFEHFSRIMHKYWRWLFQLITICAFFTYMDVKTAQIASGFTLAITSASMIKEFLNKFSKPF